MAIPVDKIVIFVRNNYDISHIKMLDNRKIIAKITNIETPKIFTTMIKELYQKSPNLAKNFVNNHVFEIMNKYSKGHFSYCYSASF